MIFQCDAEVNFLEGQIGLPPTSSSASNNSRSYVQPGSQLEMVLAEARRLEEAAHRNEDELRQLVCRFKFIIIYFVDVNYDIFCRYELIMFFFSYLD